MNFFENDFEIMYNFLETTKKEIGLPNLIDNKKDTWQNDEICNSFLLLCEKHLFKLNNKKKYNYQFSIKRMKFERKSTRKSTT